MEQERKLPPQVPEDEEDALVLPPPYVPDTDNGDGSSQTEGQIEYAVLDWHN